MEKHAILGFGPNDSDTIRKWLLGGVGAGAGLGLLTSFVNYLNGLNKKKEDDDDDTLYVYKKASADNSYLATPTAIVGGIGSGLLSYALIRKLYTQFKLKEAQAELDRAQKAFINSSGYEVSDKKKKDKKDKKEKMDKKASDGGRGFTQGEVLLSLPVLLPSLLALGAGVTAYKFMDNKFPINVKKPKAPKRIEVIEKPDDDQEEYEKSASAEDREADACEYLIRMALLTKSANSDLANLVAATASGEFDEFEKTANAIGFIEALDTVKGAAHRDIDPFAEHVAISLLAKNAAFKNQVGLLAAGEFAESQKHAYLQACHADENTQDCLYKIAGCLGRAIRYELSEDLGVKPPRNLEKQAASIDAVGDMALSAASSKLLRMMMVNKAINNKSNDDDEDNSDESDANDDSTAELEEGSSSTATDTSGEESDIKMPNSPSRRKKKDKVKFISNTKSRRGFLANIEPDVIDKILTP